MRMQKNVAPIIKKIWVAVRSQSGVDDVNESHSTYFMSALRRMKSATIVRSKDTTRMCKSKRQEASRTEGKFYRKSNASVHHTCEEQKFEDPASSEETKYYVEQIATVEKVHHIGSKAEFHDIKINGHDIRMQNDTG